MPQPTTPRELARKLGHVPLLVVLAVFVGCSAAPVSVGTSSADQPASQSTRQSTATSAAPIGASSDSIPVRAVETESPPVGEVIVVWRVVDGDTLEISGGRTIRVLGIDSCEMNTPGGQQAKSDAESLLASRRPITMTAEPGVDTDQYGRLLRYVQLGLGSDFGEEMVKDDHTGVYQGENDASPEYVQRLYAADLVNAKNPPAGRDCGEPAPAAAPAPAPAAKPAPRPAPAPAPEPGPAPASNCHPSYEPCIPDGPDLDCGDLSHSVRVVGPDEYRLDRDKDGTGCE